MKKFFFRYDCEECDTKKSIHIEQQLGVKKMTIIQECKICHTRYMDSYRINGYLAYERILRNLRKEQRSASNN